MIWVWVIVVPVVLLLVVGLWVDRGRSRPWRVNGSAHHGGDPESKFFNRYGSS